MPGVPGLRTSPTVKPLATMNAQRLRSWEIRLGPVQTVMLLGVVFGSLASAFYLGAWSGQKVGFEVASEVSRSAVPKELIVEPITTEGEDEDSGEKKRELFDRLRETKSTQDLTPAGDLQPSHEAVTAPNTTKEDSSHTGGVETPAQKIDQELKPREGSVVALNVPSPIASPVASQLPKVVGEPLKGRVLGENSAAKTGSIFVAKGSESVHKETVHKETIGSLLDTHEKGKPEEKKGIEKQVVATPTPKATAVANVAGKESVVKDTVAKKEPAAGAVKVSSGLAEGWYVQLMAPKSVQEANSVVQSLTKSGFKAQIEKATVKGDEYFRVVVGPESSRELATRLLDQVKREKLTKSEPFVRAVKR